jgi:hypothetical protein
MAVNLSIKGVPEALAARLRARAERNHRSLQGELMAIVSEAALEVIPSPPARPPGLVDHVAGKGTKVGSKTTEQIAAELHVLFPEPIRRGPLGVDIVRADRDSR